jgi:hypothetical protein
MEIWNEEKGKVTYKNAWVTDKEISEENVQLLAECGRTRVPRTWEEPRR